MLKRFNSDDLNDVLTNLASEVLNALVKTANFKHLDEVLYCLKLDDRKAILSTHNEILDFPKKHSIFGYDAR
jgi:hypothetical protein